MGGWGGGGREGVKGSVCGGGGGGGDEVDKSAFRGRCGWKANISKECVVPHDSAHSTDHWIDSLTSTGLPRPVYLAHAFSSTSLPRPCVSMWPITHNVRTQSLADSKSLKKRKKKEKKNGYSEHASRRDIDL